MQAHKNMPRVPIHRDREPISAASLGLALVPTILKAIFHLGAKIRSTVQNHGSNREDCVALWTHVDAIISSLQYLEGSGEPQGHLIGPLENLMTCLTQCSQFLESYTSTLPIQQVILSGHYKRKFERLNSDLDKSQNLLYQMTVLGTSWRGPTEQLLTNSTLYLDGQQRHKNLAQSRHKHNPSPSFHSMHRSPMPSPHQNRHIHRSHSAANMSSSPRVLIRHGSIGKLHQ